MSKELRERCDYLLGQCETVNNTNHELRARIKQLESLLKRIHKATHQFYQQPAEPKPEAPVPYEEIVRLYHFYMADLPTVAKITEKRKAAMRQRWKNDLTSLDDWVAYFEDACRKPFLFGRNERGWTADFDFFLREDVIAKMQEGKYG